MKSQTNIMAYLDHHTMEASQAFHGEISTEENKDYRRGFRAGVLFTLLQLKSDIGSMDDAAAEQPTD